MRALVTGSAGSVGRVLVERLREQGHPVFPFDTANDDALSVLDEGDVYSAVVFFKPDVIFHLAAWKLAPEGELEPYECARVNIEGTQNILAGAEKCGAKVILTSTCKACDPETAYGASKLIAERMVLNAGGTVVRFYNIPEADDNVFRLWESLPESEPIPYTNCERYFVSMDASVALLIRAAGLPPGRYAPMPPASRTMEDVAEQTYPDREHVRIPRRRGDRLIEPARARDELFSFAGDGIAKITGSYDSVPVVPESLAA